MPSAAFIASPPLPAARTPPRAAGCRVWDGEDGAARVDFDMGGGAVILGHAHPAVEAGAARGAGEAQTGGALRALSPAAQAARFTAAESQALPAAIAAARRVTGRRRVLACEPAGPVGEPDSLAALVVDPLGADIAQLQAARQLADAAGAVLIFDEGVSAFRVHERGAQGLSGVIPDLAVYGAAIANGRPLGAVAGRRDLVAALDEADLPAPFPASLGAAAAAMHILAHSPAAPQIQVLGAEVQAEVSRLVASAGAERFFALAGDPALPSPLFAAPQLEGLWLREMSSRGFIVVGPHAFSAAHGEAEAEALIEAYAAVLPAMVAKGLVEALLRRPPPPFSGQAFRGFP